MHWRVLLLDQGYQPVKVISWQKAIGLLIKGKAEIVEDADSFPIRTENVFYRLTNVIRQLTDVVKKKRSLSFSRHNIFLRDKWTCQYCGEKKAAKNLTWDHVFPQSRGGPTEWTNITTACFPCNQKKANRTPQEAGMRLIKKPIKPKVLVDLTIRVKGPLKSIPESWRTYIDPQSFAYWHVSLEEG